MFLEDKRDLHLNRIQVQKFQIRLNERDIKKNRCEWNKKRAFLKKKINLIQELLCIMREAPKDFDYSSEIEKYENEVRVIKEKILKNDKIVSECKKINEERRKNRGVNLKWKK